jgi:hypothetical protein
VILLYIKEIERVMVFLVKNGTHILLEKNIVRGKLQWGAFEGALGVGEIPKECALRTIFECSEVLCEENDLEAVGIFHMTTIIGNH